MRILPLEEYNSAVHLHLTDKGGSHVKTYSSFRHCRVVVSG